MRNFFRYILCTLVITNIGSTLFSATENSDGLFTALLLSPQQQASFMEALNVWGKVDSSSLHSYQNIQNHPQDERIEMIQKQSKSSQHLNQYRRIFQDLCGFSPILPESCNPYKLAILGMGLENPSTQLTTFAGIMQKWLTPDVLWRILVISESPELIEAEHSIQRSKHFGDRHYQEFLRKSTEHLKNLHVQCVFERLSVLNGQITEEAELVGPDALNAQLLIKAQQQESIHNERIQLYKKVLLFSCENTFLNAEFKESFKSNMEEQIKNFETTLRGIKYSIELLNDKEKLAQEILSIKESTENHLQFIQQKNEELAQLICNLHTQSTKDLIDNPDSEVYEGRFWAIDSILNALFPNETRKDTSHQTHKNQLLVDEQKRIFDERVTTLERLFAPTSQRSRSSSIQTLKDLEESLIVLKKEKSILEKRLKELEATSTETTKKN